MQNEELLNPRCLSVLKDIPPFAGTSDDLRSGQLLQGTVARDVIPRCVN